MTRLRLHLRGRRIVPLLLVAVLFARLVAPAGFMPGLVAGGFAIVPCSGHGPALAMAEAHAMSAMHHAPAHDGGHDGQGKTDKPCGFAGVALPGMAGADPIQLLLALAFILAVAHILATRPLPARALRWRPPLRGPPA